MVADVSPLQGRAIAHILSRRRPDMEYVGQALSGTEGIALAEKVCPDIVFTDMVLPELDGMSMAERLISEFKDINIIILTAADDYYLIEKALHSGIRQFLLKPASQDEILRALGMITAGRGEKEALHPAEEEKLRYNDFLQILVNGSMDQITQSANDITKHILKCSGEKPDEVRAQFVSLASRILPLEKRGDSDHYLYVVYRDYLNSIVSGQTCESLAATFMEFVERVAAVSHPVKNYGSLEIISKIQEIIDQRLNTNITLESIAAEMYFTTSYLSRLYKKEMGKNFSEYLIDRRLERAKLLLLSTNQTIESIAQEVGYENPNSFRRLFKSKVGISASEYRALKK
jgi:two-component system response regulator YesN